MDDEDEEGNVIYDVHDTGSDEAENVNNDDQNDHDDGDNLMWTTLFSETYNNANADSDAEDNGSSKEDNDADADVDAEGERESGQHRLGLGFGEMNTKRSLLSALDRPQSYDTPGIMLHPLIQEHTRALLLSANINPPPRASNKSPIFRFQPSPLSPQVTTTPSAIVDSTASLVHGEEDAMSSRKRTLSEPMDDDVDDGIDTSEALRNVNSNSEMTACAYMSSSSSSKSHVSHSSATVPSKRSALSSRNPISPSLVTLTTTSTAFSSTSSISSLPYLASNSTLSRSTNVTPPLTVSEEKGNEDNGTVKGKENEEKNEINPERLQIERIHLHMCQELKRQDLCFIVDQPLKEFSFTHAKISHTFLSQAAVCWKDTLVYLNLQKSGVRSDSIACLESLKNLKYLDISCTKVTTLPKLPRLEILHAEKSRLSSSSIVELSQCSRFLSELYLAHSYISSNIFVALSVMPRLKCLSIASCAGFQTSHAVADEKHNAAVLQFFTTKFTDIASKNLIWLDVSFTAAPSEFFSMCMERFPALRYLGLASTPAAAAFPPTIDMSDMAVATGTIEHGRQSVISFLVNTPIYHGSAITDGLRSLYQHLNKSASSDNFEWIHDEPSITLLVIDVLWEYMHLYTTDIVLIASACLYYCTWIQPQSWQEKMLRMDAVCVCKALLSVQMFNSQVVKNSCFILKNFVSTMETVAYADDLVKLLFTACVQHTDMTIRESAVHVCCSILGKLSTKMKEEIVTKSESANLLLELLEPYHDGRAIEDEDALFFELCWMFLWDITDENPIACEALLEMECTTYVKNALKQLNRVGIVRNVMGLVANISEVDSLRHALIDDDLFELLFLCLAQIEDLEVEYNTTGVLCHLLTHPSALSNITLVKKISSTVIDAVDKWDPAADRNINYRSLRPIFFLLSRSEIALQYWAVWALQNLCLINPGRYCQMCFNEGGYMIVSTLEERTMHCKDEGGGRVDDKGESSDDSGAKLQWKINASASSIRHILDEWALSTKDT
eukprot:m.63830 g.63830  ORF g.63830 m.63830 type:complete len:1011 (-) comp8088_c1_seq11:163-3195(-)